MFALQKLHTVPGWAESPRGGIFPWWTLGKGGEQIVVGGFVKVYNYQQFIKSCIVCSADELKHKEVEVLHNDHWQWVENRLLLVTSSKCTIISYLWRVFVCSAEAPQSWRWDQSPRGGGVAFWALAMGGVEVRRSWWHRQSA